MLITCFTLIVKCDVFFFCLKGKKEEKKEFTTIAIV